MSHGHSLAADQPAGNGVLVGLDRLLALLTEVPAALMVVAEIGILLTGVTARFVFDRPLTWSDELASIVFLWLAMFGAAIALRRDSHMRMTLVAEAVSGRARRLLEVLSVAVPLLFLGILILPAINFAEDQSYVQTPALGLVDTIRAAAVPVGTLLMIAACLARLARFSLVEIMSAALVLATLAALLFAFRGPLQAMGNWNLLVFFAGLLTLAVASGAPIAFGFALCTAAYLITTSSTPLEVIPGRMDEGMSGLILLAVPLFIFLGHLIVMTRMATRMVEFLAALVGHVKGGLAYVLLGAMLLVSGISGAKTADMAAVAPVLFPDMRKRGIHEGELVSLLAASGAMAETIPPSIVLIIIGSVAGVSINALFTGGVLPGLVLALALAAIARRRMGDSAGMVARAPLPTIGRTFVIALPALLLPVVIRLAVSRGIATATEVATVGIAYGLLVGIVVYRTFDWRALYPSLVDTAALSGTILFIIGAATAMAWALTQSNFSHALAAAMATIPGGAIGFLLISIVVFIVLGSVLEGIPAMVLFGPLLFPVARSLGVHDVQYAMVVILAMGIGLFAPPFGLGYYAACSIGRVDPNAGIKRIWPYLAALVAGVVLVALVPWISVGLL